jgi:hypothetical protein
MKQSELADSIDTIESSAAEGSLIASHDADAENDDVAADQERAIDIAGQASEQLGQLQSEPDDSEAARAISTRLRELADSASSLGEHL